MSEEIRTQLETYYHQNLPGMQNARVQNLAQMNQGWESIIYAFDLLPDDQSRPLAMVLRIYPGMDAFQKSKREFDGMRTLARTGYPVPRVDYLERSDSPFKKPFLLMERIPGETLWPVLSRSRPEITRDLLKQFTSLLVRLHRLHWPPFVPQAEQDTYTDPYVFVDRWLAEVHGIADQFPDLKAFNPVMDWLEARRDQVPCSTPAPIHWDFHPNNLILGPQGNLTVIDWTQIQISDPRFDLSWTLLLAGAYEGAEVREMILEDYQQMQGTQVEQLAFFDVANCLKRLGSVMLSVSAGADQMGMRPDAVEQMRHDLVSLRYVYALLQSHTGLKVDPVEQFLSAM